MYKLIILIILFMVMIFSVAATVIPGSKQKTNPVADIGKEITRPLTKVDTITPELSHALDNVKLPSIATSKPKEEVLDARALGDHTGEIYSNKDLPKANFAGSLINATLFDGALLDGAVLEGAQGKTVNFVKARMAKANLNAVILPGADFNGAELREATARAGNFSKSLFAGADISFASFSGSNLSNADLRNTYGAGAIFVGANLDDADFTGADLMGARFNQAILRDVIFAAADMSLADFTGASIQGADLSGALNLTSEQLAGACADKSTKLPEGVTATIC